MESYYPRQRTSQVSSEEWWRYDKKNLLIPTSSTAKVLQQFLMGWQDDISERRKFLRKYEVGCFGSTENMSSTTGVVWDDCYEDIYFHKMT